MRFSKICLAIVTAVTLGHGLSATLTKDGSRLELRRDVGHVGQVKLLGEHGYKLVADTVGGGYQSVKGIFGRHDGHDDGNIVVVATKLTDVTVFVNTCTTTGVEVGHSTAPFTDVFTMVVPQPKTFLTAIATTSIYLVLSSEVYTVPTTSAIETPVVASDSLTTPYGTTPVDVSRTVTEESIRTVNTCSVSCFQVTPNPTDKIYTPATISLPQGAETPQAPVTSTIPMDKSTIYTTTTGRMSVETSPTEIQTTPSFFQTTVETTTATGTASGKVHPALWVLLGFMGFTAVVMVCIIAFYWCGLQPRDSFINRFIQRMF